MRETEIYDFCAFHDSRETQLDKPAIEKAASWTHRNSAAMKGYSSDVKLVQASETGKDADVALCAVDQHLLSMNV